MNRKEVNKANPRYVQITVNSAGKNSIGLTNEGFLGMGLPAGHPKHGALETRKHFFVEEYKCQ